MKLELERPRQCADYNLAICVLASGSKGNSIYISDGSTAILIDAGLSARELKHRIKSRGLNPGDLNAILVTHEHSDHIQAVSVLSRQLKLPVYLSRNIEKKVSRRNRLYEIRAFNSGSTFRIDNLAVQPFAVSHDATDPVGFTIGQNGSRIGVATDLGTVTAHVKENLKHCQLLILEANHDPHMLTNGPYPWYLKRRIQSSSGHLSNEQSKYLLMELQHEGLEHVILAHLSQTNNAPQKVLTEVSAALTRSKPRLTVASQDRCGEVIYLK
ncbi:MAG: MBL fold metallo-hydrolase [Deltaproteobacteria bacterium]|jgi:phosphoribosyl 1,2-cyclic phosphodiesterase|nr:MBL fold metallo-hydrolase [Deltaproteobacteria bacterium]